METKQSSYAQSVEHYETRKECLYALEKLVFAKGKFVKADKRQGTVERYYKNNKYAITYYRCHGYFGEICVTYWVQRIFFFGLIYGNTVADFQYYPRFDVFVNEQDNNIFTGTGKWATYLISLANKFKNISIIGDITDEYENGYAGD